MSSIRQYAVLQKDSTPPSVGQLKNVFRLFHNLTDADAIRLAATSGGILARHLTREAGDAFQKALRAEGVNSVLVAEDELPKPAESRPLHRLEISTAACVVFDVLGHETRLAWDEIAALCAGAVKQLETKRAFDERGANRMNPSTSLLRPAPADPVRKLKLELTLLLEIVVKGTLARYEVDAERFVFNYLISGPDLSVPEKFTWLVRQLCRRAPDAILNRGAQILHEGSSDFVEYTSRQMLTDEMVWLLWRSAQKPRDAEM